MSVFLMALLGALVAGVVVYLAAPYIATPRARPPQRRHRPLPDRRHLRPRR